MPLTDFVYRVERHEIPTNPYDWRSPESLSDMHRIHCRTPHTPPPERDGLDWGAFANGQRFGFATRLGALQWFAGWHRLLTEEGFFLATYLVDPDDLAHGRTQLVFDPDRAVRITADPLTWH